MSKSDAALRLIQVKRSFTQGDTTIDVLRGVDLALQPGEIVGLVGPSGAGKSTLLQITGLLERPDSGDVIVGGVSCGDLDDAGRTEMRRTRLGFVYQFHHLLPEFTAIENVMLPQLINGTGKSDASARAQSLLETVGLGERASHHPSELSGGEQQRVAIVRALANSPDLLLADEPTGNLDEQTSAAVFARLQETVREAGVAALIATHNIELAKRMDRVVRLHEGVLEAV